MAVDTFDVRTEFPVVVAERRRMVASDLRGAFQRRQTQTAVADATEQAVTRSWLLTWRKLQQSEVDRLDTLYDSSAGGAGTLSWEPPDIVGAIEVRIVPDSYSVERVTNGPYYTGRLELEEAP